MATEVEGGCNLLQEPGKPGLYMYKEELLT